MQIIYPGIKKEVGEAQFILVNKLGGYLYLGSNPASRYQGLFFMDNFRMYKTIDNIELAKPIEEIKFNFNSIERKRGDVKESFFLPNNFNSLVYELDKECEIGIILDCRESYDNAEFGRFYQIEESRGKIVITYTKQDWQEELKEYVIYLVIRPERLKYEKIDSWSERQYSMDETRKSQPYKRYVYSALKLNAKKVVFSMSLDKKTAMREADYVFEKADFLKKKAELRNRCRNSEINLAYNCAANSLKGLTFSNNTVGIFAGLPWFFQFWTRDEFICGKALSMIGKNDFLKKMLISQLNAITFDGRMFDKYPASGLKDADSAAWLFKRLSELNLNKKEKGLVKEKLAFCLNAINSNHCEEGLVKNNPCETWMDTGYGGDSRPGFRIEIQAMHLFMCRMMHKLSGDENYRRREVMLGKKIRERFWNGKYLADGLNDFTIRPNIFIAAYFYPELLTDGEWGRCFERVLPSLWLEWGGLSTIDTNNPLFTPEHTGEDNKSYHRGDSWFWLNNLAAIVMHRVDKQRFKPYIDKILEANTQEILYNGAIGTAGELSSAKELKSEGCLMQAWSNAMFIEMIEELF